MGVVRWFSDGLVAAALRLRFPEIRVINAWKKDENVATVLVLLNFVLIPITTKNDEKRHKSCIGYRYVYTVYYGTLIRTYHFGLAPKERVALHVIWN